MRTKRIRVPKKKNTTTDNKTVELSDSGESVDNINIQDMPSVKTKIEAITGSVHESEKTLPLAEQLKITQQRYQKLLEVSLIKGIGSRDNYNILGSVFTKSVSKKAEILKEIKKVDNSFLYQAILDLLVNDMLSPSTVTNDVIHLTSENDTVKKELDILQENIDFDGFAVQVLEDLLSLGEYYLSVESEQGKGVLKINDNIDQSQVVSVYEGLYPIQFLQIDDLKKHTSQVIQALAPDKLAHFVIGQRKLRIKIEKGLTNEFVRIGRPLFFGTYDLLANLQLLISLVPASYLQKINNTSILGIQVPEATDPQDAFDVCRRYEDLLNKTISFDPNSGDISLADVLSAAGKIKVIPIYDTKGNLTKVDPRFEEIIDVSLLTEIKQDIMATIGVPFSFLFGGDILRGDQLRQFARYVRKLHMGQCALAAGFKQVASIHLKAKGIVPAPGHIQVRFTNALISVESLDRIEFLDTLISTLGNLSETVQNIAKNTGATMNGKELGLFMNKFLKILNLEKLFTFPSGEIKPLENIDNLGLMQDILGTVTEMRNDLVNGAFSKFKGNAVNI